MYRTAARRAVVATPAVRLAIALSLAAPGCGRPDDAAPTGPDAYRLADAFPALRFTRPLCLAHAGDGSGRLFVVEQAGRIHVFPGRRDVASASVFLDLTAIVRTDHDEEGLLALAFHPDYARNGYFYVWHSASDPLRNVLARYRVAAGDSNRADPGSRTVLLEIPKPYGNHNGATLVFGGDGFLYLSPGDGGAGGDPHGNGQNLGSLLGKILRLDVDRSEAGRAYAVPADNPFVGRPDARGEIWAWGLRNVWRMSFDRTTGTLWAADVGQNAWEEIDLVERGGNYGWNLREGRHPFRSGAATAPLLDPVHEYSHADGASITGGHVYRGSALPELAGWYVYADYVVGTVWALDVEDGVEVANRVLVHQPRNIASFGEGPDGELYLLAFDGKIYTLEASAAGGRR